LERTALERHDSPLEEQARHCVGCDLDHILSLDPLARFMPSGQISEKERKFVQIEPRFPGYLHL
jgi:hypothetical protein